MSKESRVAVVTGSNKDIGLAIVKELCTKFDGHVYLTSRNESLGKSAVAELEKLGLHPKYHQLDIDDESSVIKLRDHLKSTYGGLDVLVNNAAICFWLDSVAVSFYEKAVQTLRVNYFNTKRVCDLLFPILKPHARVVNMSSVSGHLSMIQSEELRSKFAAPNLSVLELDALMKDYIESAKNGDHVEKGWSSVSSNGSVAMSNDVVTEYLRSKGLDQEAIEKAFSSYSFSAYRMSKVGLSALTRIQQRHFDQDPRPDLIVNSVHPGYVDTDMTKHLGGVPIEQGAVAPSWLALLPADVDGPKGAYVWSDKQVVDWVNGPTPGPY